MRLIKVAFLLGAAALLWACTPPTTNGPTQPSRVDVIVTQIQTGAPSPSPGPSCLAVQKVVLNTVSAFTHPGPVGLGFTSFDVNGPRPRSCDGASTEAWTTTSPCTIDRPGAVNPFLSASGSGQCLVAVDVDGSVDAENITVN